MIARVLGWIRRLSVADYVILFSVGTLALILAYPTLAARDFRRAVEETIAEVEGFRAGAERIRQENRGWPASAAPGDIPAEFTGLFLGDTSLVRGMYTLQWQRWDVVDYTEAPPDLAPLPEDAPPDSVGPDMLPVVSSMGGIVLHSAESELLAELLGRFGSEESFVRDTTWTLLLPTRGGSG